jgi:hypothetical protein
MGMFVSDIAKAQTAVSTNQPNVPLYPQKRTLIDGVEKAGIQKVSSVVHHLGPWKKRTFAAAFGLKYVLAVDKAVSVEQVGEFALKGIRRPMQTYNWCRASRIHAQCRSRNQCRDPANAISASRPQ